MVHKSIVNGTIYEVAKGKDLVGGTVYEKDHGNVMVGGTVYKIEITSPETVEIEEE